MVPVCDSRVARAEASSHCQRKLGPSARRRRTRAARAAIASAASRINGETCEVLLDHQDNVLLIGQDWVLSTDQAPAKRARYQVSARPLMTL